MFNPKYSVSHLSRQPDLLIGDLIQYLYQRVGVRMSHTTAYNPAGNGTCERVNGTIMDKLNKSISDGSNWVEKVLEVTFHYNISVHSSTGYSPYFLTFGINSNIPTGVAPIEVIRGCFPRFDITLPSQVEEEALLPFQYVSNVRNRLAWVKRQVREALKKNQQRIHQQGQNIRSHSNVCSSNFVNTILSKDGLNQPSANELDGSELLDISLEEFQQYIKDKSPNKAPGKSGLSINVFKGVGDEFFELLFEVTKRIISSLPRVTSWREKLVILLPKENNKDVRKQRPISFLEVW